MNQLYFDVEITFTFTVTIPRATDVTLTSAKLLLVTLRNSETKMMKAAAVVAVPEVELPEVTSVMLVVTEVIACN